MTLALLEKKKANYSFRSPFPHPAPPNQGLGQTKSQDLSINSNYCDEGHIFYQVFHCEPQVHICPTTLIITHTDSQNRTRNIWTGISELRV